MPGAANVHGNPGDGSDVQEDGSDVQEGVLATDEYG